MGLLDSILGSALGGGQAPGGGGNAALLNLVLGMLTQGSGASAAAGGAAAGGGGPLAGLGDLIGQFQRSGLGDVVASWISTGQNLPVSPDQLGQVLGGDRVAGMASQLGVDPGDLLGQLSQVLPQVVDQLTPAGQVPQSQQELPDLGSLGNLLGGLLARR